MKIGSQSHNSSAISTANAERIIVRGRDLVNDLIGQVSFADYFWFLVSGAAASPIQSRLLNATLVAIAEHGLVPSVQASRMTLAAAPESLQGAVAAGLLGCGSVILGAAEAAGIFFNEIRAEEGKSNNLEQAVVAVIGQYRAARRVIPGFGHPLHSAGDPRAMRLLDLADELGASGTHVRIARLVEKQLPAALGKRLTLNVSGAIPAVLLDVGFPLQGLKGIPLLARTAGLIGHLVEESQRPIGFVMSHAAARAIEYDGAAPDDFTVSRD